MKEDILEQLADDYLQSKGYFTRHNIKFRPDKSHPDYKPKLDSNHSDIDVIGLHPVNDGPDRVWVVSCKSWQEGFSIGAMLDAIEHDKKVGNKLGWQHFRELTSARWTKAFLDAVKEETDATQFTYVLAVTFASGDKETWEKNQNFKQALNDNPIKIITLSEMLSHFKRMKSKTVASSDIGRVLQLMKAAEKGDKALRKAVEMQTTKEEVDVAVSDGNS